MPIDDAILTGEQVERLRAVLEKRRKDVERGLAAAGEDAAPVGLDLSIGRLTRVDALQQQHMASSRRRQLEVELARIRQALARIEGPTFGECDLCGEPIGYRRLLVRPEATLCVRCQEESTT
jgi:DnaK suppressor protein